MKQPAYPKRSRGRPFERRAPKNNGHRVSLSEERQKATHQQAMDKYLNLAREAASSGDPVSAESYYQYADHYYRLLSAYRSERPVEGAAALPKETSVEASSAASPEDGAASESVPPQP